LAEIASNLGVSEATVAACMPRAEQGARPERPNPASITNCLQAEGATVTVELVSQTLESFGPEQRSRRN
jgi:hypothetical protein